MPLKYLDKDGLNYLMNKIKPKDAEESGTDISLVTTGEKYKWNSTYEQINDNGDTDSIPYVYRQTGGDAKVGNLEKLEEIVGGSVVWNQLVALSNIKETQTVNGITFTNNGDGTVTINGTATDTIDVAILSSIKFPRRSHKVLIDFAKMSQASSGFFVNGYGTGSRRTSSFIFYKTDATDWTGNLSLSCPSGTVFNNYKTSFAVFDLTAMFGSTIADYIYSLEQVNEGDGVAFFREFFPNDYYEYNAGEMLMSVSGVKSHKTVGFNQFDKNASYTNDSSYRFVDVQIGATNTLYMKLVDKDTSVNISDIYLGFRQGTTGRQGFAYRWIISNGVVSDNKTNIGNAGYPLGALCEKVFVYPNNADAWDRLNRRFDICVNLSDSAKNGTYEPYKTHSYPLDSDLTLRGIPKLDSNNKLYFDGDTYEADGTVTRRYGIVDLGTLGWSVADDNIFYNSSIINKARKNISIICSKYANPYTVNTRLDAMIDKTAQNRSDTDVIYIKDTAYTDAATFKAAMSGVMLVYELATPYTEIAQPFQELQECDPDGTEEFVYNDDVSVKIPVGHTTKYLNSISEKVDILVDITMDQLNYGFYIDADGDLCQR